VRKPAEPESRRAWAPEDDAALQAARAADEPLDALAARLGRSRRAVEARLDVLDELKRRAETRRRRLAEEEE
jgi:hypothetical protein